MEIANNPVYINIARPGVYATIHAKQSDVNRAFTAVFNIDGVAWPIPENAVISVWYRGASGMGNYTKGIEISGNTAVIPLIPQMLAVPGTGQLCIIVNTATGDQIGTWNIPYSVEAIPGGNSEAATEFYTAFSESVAVVTTAANEAALAALAQAKESGEFDGEKGDPGATGQRGTGFLPVTTAPSSNATEVGGSAPKYRMALSTIKSQSGATEVLLGDIVRYSYYDYPIAYLDSSYAYFTTRTSIRGATGSAGAAGADGKSAYAYAQDGGFTGTEEEFAEMLASGGGYEAETELVLSDNLLDKSLMTRGGVFYYSSNGLQLVTGSADSYYGYIPLRGAGTYRTKFQASVHSSTDKRIALVDDDDIFVTNVIGSHGEIPTDLTRNWLDFEFVVTQAHIDAGATRIAFDVYSGVDDEFYNQTMIVKDREYPSEYIPYGYIEVVTDSGKKQNNVLCAKTAVFLGDSICAGTTVGTDSEYYGYGWAGLIGEANRMNWFNYGKNGGTITHRGTDGTCIAKIADTAIAEHPNADYVIFDGGCNDADQMRDAGLGEISADYATFDTATFSGALEALILKLVTAYPNAKIGYIIPQKMYTGYADYTAAKHIHRKYFDRAVEICRKWGIPVVDIWNGSMLNPKLSTASIYYVEENGQHLTEAGYLAITPMIEAWMRNMYVSGAAAVAGGNTGGVTSWNDLTDKPFGDHADNVVVLPKTYFVSGIMDGALIAMNRSVELVEGETYTVNWNGTDYETVCFMAQYDGEDVLALGNPIAVGGTNNNQPFVIGAADNAVGAIPLDGSTSAIASIKGYGSAPVPLQYLTNVLPFYVDAVALTDELDTTIFCSETADNLNEARKSGREIKLRVSVYGESAINIHPLVTIAKSGQYQEAFFFPDMRWGGAYMYTIYPQENGSLSVSHYLS